MDIFIGVQMIYIFYRHSLCSFIILEMTILQGDIANIFIEFLSHFLWRLKLDQNLNSTIPRADTNSYTFIYASLGILLDVHPWYFSSSKYAFPAL